MEILFVTNPVAGLYIEIEREMIRQGHHVTTIIDTLLKHDPSMNTIPIISHIKIPVWKKAVRNHWNKLFETRIDLKIKYDVLFVISGCSIDSSVVDKLKINNPDLHTVLYTWDSCNHYNFERHFPYFDKCYTFDIQDSKRNPNWELLPIYYVSQPQLSSKSIEYDLFSMGSNHDGRYSFIKKILPQLKGIIYYIKIVSKEYNYGIKEIIRVYLGCNNQLKEEIDFSKGKENAEILLRESISPSEYISLVTKSHVILDDQREGQSGLTARFMWALGNGKKIITTNKWAYDYPFVNHNQVAIISKDSPKISLEFVKKEMIQDDNTDVRQYEISKWVSLILSKYEVDEEDL